MISKKRMLLLSSLILLTFLGGALVYAELASQEPVESGLYYCAEPLAERPEKYWNLTDPDPYVLQAIRNPSAWVEVNESDTTFLKEVYMHSNVFCIQYNGDFYDVIAKDVVNCLHLELRPTSIMMLTALGASWAVALVPLWFKRRM